MHRVGHVGEELTVPQSQQCGPHASEEGHSGPRLQLLVSMQQKSAEDQSATP